MTTAGGAIGDRRPFPRFVLLATIAAAHLLAIWVLLQSRAVPAALSAEPAMALFDIIPPVPPPTRPAPAPPPQPRSTEKSGGGSPGVRREQAAAMIETPAPPAREAMDATLASLPLPVSPLPTAGTGVVDLGRGGADGVGSGVGSGDHNGQKSGTGERREDAYVHAEWIERPSMEAYLRHWPGSRVLPSYPITVRMTCYVRPNGAPYRCQNISERPLNAGFRDMVVSAVMEAKVRPVSKNGTPLWRKPVIITIVLDKLEAVARIIEEASAPRAR